MLLTLAICIVCRHPYLLFTDTIPAMACDAPLSRRARRGALRWVLRHSCAVLTTGQPGIEATKREGISNQQIIDFPYTIDAHRLMALAHHTESPTAITGSRRQQPTVILYSGQLIERKGLDVLLHALSTIRDLPFMLWIEGTGPMEQYYRRLATDLELAEKVSFLSFQQEPEHAATLASADILVVPSRWDPWGNLIHEGMIFGLAVIASDKVAAAVDRIQSGVNGFIFQSEDADGLSVILSQLITSKNLRGKLGRLAIDTASHYPSSYNADNLYRYLSAVVCSQSSSRRLAEPGDTT